MVIGLYGLDFGSNNLGCVALSYGFIEIIKSVFKNEKIELVSFDECNEIRTNQLINASNVHLSVPPQRSLKSISGWKELVSDFKKCDIIFDFTAGDSFSDIYGKSRFFTRSIRKEIVLLSRVPLVLGSQTYGPYKSKLVRLMASHIIKNSYEVFSRDSKSSRVIKEIAHRTPIQTIDVAFELPYKKQKSVGDKIKIGINPSGLLWTGGYIGTNQFGLMFDYKTFIIELISELLKNENFEVYLVSHVRSDDLQSRDNDMIACNELIKMFPKLIGSPFFDTPMDAKSYISGLDYFIGSRMHATIAAFTSGVITIPIAYSRKFEGLFHDLDYPFVINATEDDKSTAIRKVFEVLNNHEETNSIYNKSLSKSIELREALKRDYEEILKKFSNGEKNERKEDN